MKIDTLRAIHGDCCHYCKVRMVFGIKTKSHKNPLRATVEHLIPAYESPNLKKIGGFDNCVLACTKCNNERSIAWQNDPANKERVIRLHFSKVYKKYKRWCNRSDIDSKDLARVKRNVDDLLNKYEFLKEIF